MARVHLTLRTAHYTTQHTQPNSLVGISKPPSDSVIRPEGPEDRHTQRIPRKETQHFHDGKTVTSPLEKIFEVCDDRHAPKQKAYGDGRTNRQAAEHANG